LDLSEYSQVDFNCPIITKPTTGYAVEESRLHIRDKTSVSLHVQDGTWETLAITSRQRDQKKPRFIIVAKGFSNNELLPIYPELLQSRVTSHASDLKVTPKCERFRDSDAEFQRIAVLTVPLRLVGGRGEGLNPFWDLFAMRVGSIGQLDVASFLRGRRIKYYEANACWSS